MAQHITVIGAPIRCGEQDCGEVATMMIRQLDHGGAEVSVIQYCDTCWLAYRRGYAPMVAHDAVQAITEAEALTRGDDGREKANTPT